MKFINVHAGLIYGSVFCISLLSLDWIAAAPAAIATPDASAKKANVVILLSDDLGYKDIGCYDGPVKTPALDALAAGGTRFQTFYSGCAVCSPSRATLLTGRHHIRTGVYSWIHDPSQKSHLLEREITLAEILKAQGYATCHVGKWHLGLPGKKFDKPTPKQHGFDHWFATWNNAEPSHHNPKGFIRNGKELGEIKGYACQIVVDEAIDWLDKRTDEQKDQPFFLNVWFHEPHQRIAAPKAIVDQYKHQVTNPNVKPQKNPAVYSATIDNTDRAIARLLKKLKEVALEEETLIIYGSDNGSYRNERTGDLRGSKGSNWEGGLRVPGIFYWPGKIKAGQVQQSPAGLVDVVPTICGLLGIKKPEVHLDGSDLSSVLTQAGEFKRHQPLFWHLQKSRPIVVMRDGDYALTASPDYELSKENMFQEVWIPKIRSGGYKGFQLFNLSKDPNQKIDIAKEHPELVAELKKKLLAINQSVMADGHVW